MLFTLLITCQLQVWGHTDWPQLGRLLAHWVHFDQYATYRFGLNWIIDCLNVFKNTIEENKTYICKETSLVLG